MWDQRYSEPGYAYGESPNDFLVEALERLGLDRGKALCLADGEGRNGVYLAEQGLTVTSVDLSQVGLKKSKDLAKRHRVRIETVHADLAEFDMGHEQWDLIVSIFAHFPEELRKPIHARIAPALKPGGHLILEGYTPANVGRGVGGPPTAASAYTPEALKDDFANLLLISCEERERTIQEGKYHNGLSAVVQWVAQKA